VFLVGIILALWLNEILTPQLIVILGVPLNLYALITSLLFISSIIVIIDLFLFYKKKYKKLTLTWFFVGAGLVSILFAGTNLYQISYLYILNIGNASATTVQGYSFPAIYVFKLFRSIFFISVFGIIGYWNELRKKEKVPVAQNPSISLIKPVNTDESWIAKKWYATLESVDNADFEDSRRCLMNSYHSYVQTHAGYIIALTIGLFTIISASETFLKYGFWQVQAFAFYSLIAGILFGIVVMFLRIVYWTLWANVAITIPISKALEYFNNSNKIYSTKAANTAIIQSAIREQILQTIEEKKLLWYEKLAIKIAGRSFV